MSSRRDQVLQALYAAAEPLSIRDLALQLGIHANTVRHHLGRLAAQGLVEKVVTAATGRGRPAQHFRPRRVPTGDNEGFGLLAAVLVADLAGSPHAAARARSAGERAGLTLVPEARALGTRAATHRLVELMDDFGFAPERPVRGRMLLRRCPFLELAQDHRDVVCGVHLGLMRGALVGLGGAVEATGLDPLVEPDVCVAHLAGHAS